MGKVQGSPECRGPQVPGKKIFLNNFQETVKVMTSGYQTLQCFIATLPTYTCISAMKTHVKVYKVV